MANLVQNVGQHLTIDLFPSKNICCEVPDSEELSHIICSDCGSLTIQSEMEKFLRLQDAGLDTNFKCPACRDCKSCLRGAGKELLSFKEEYQQQIIEKSVRIDDGIGQAVAQLAFVGDPSEGITDNENIALRRLKNVCTKYASNTTVRERITKGFEKLLNRGHILLYEDLDAEERMDDTLDDDTISSLIWSLELNLD